MRTKFSIWLPTITIALGLGAQFALAGQPFQARPIPVQILYEMPPQFQEGPPAVTVPPNTKPLNQEELQRAEALLPLLEGKQEFWAMGEFVHLGESTVPVLVKALTMPGPNIVSQFEPMTRSGRCRRMAAAISRRSGTPYSIAPSCQPANSS